MTSPSTSSMSARERERYGAAVAKDAAFDAVLALWRRRQKEGNWTLKQAASNIDKDEGWMSKQFKGPRNWTMEIFGSLVQSLNGEVQIVVHALEDFENRRDNYDAYAEMEDAKPRVVAKSSHTFPEWDKPKHPPKKYEPRKTDPSQSSAAEKQVLLEAAE